VNQTSVQRSPGRRWLRSLLTIVIGAVVVLAAYAAGTYYESNFHTVVSGELYRSGQMDSTRLASRVRQYGIKSILNLRGPDQGAWYQAEVQTASRLGVLHYDVRLSATEEVDLSKMQDIVRLLRTAPKPILIHCKAGSDRTGLVVALYRLAISGDSPAVADRELTIWYGHLAVYQTGSMDRSYWNFVSHYLPDSPGNLQSASAAP